MGIDRKLVSEWENKRGDDNGKWVRKRKGDIDNYWEKKKKE